MSFEKGDRGEDLWVKYLQSKGVTKINRAPKGKFYDWDIKAEWDGCVRTFEVKYDTIGYSLAERRCDPENPNLYIEFENTTKGELSGIYASKADEYVYMFERGDSVAAYIFDRVMLLTHLEESNYRKVGNSSTGDDNARGWIPPLQTLIKEDCYKRKTNLK